MQNWKKRVDKNSEEEKKEKLLFLQLRVLLFFETVQWVLKTFYVQYKCTSAQQRTAWMHPAQCVPISDKGERAERNIFK